MAINFTPSSEPTLGVEVELQLVNLKMRELKKLTVTGIMTGYKSKLLFSLEVMIQSENQ